MSRQTQQRPQPDITSDSIPDRPDVRPDDLSGRNELESLDAPGVRKEATLAPDGGAADHPIHDEPIEDFEPQDYEAMIDNAEEGQIRRQTDDEIYDPRATRTFSRGSGDPLDQRSRDGELTADK